MVPEAALEQTDAGAVPATPGWFVLNAREARWFQTPGLGYGLGLTGETEYEAEPFFPMLGMTIRVMNQASRARPTTGKPSKRISWSFPAR